MHAVVRLGTQHGAHPHNALCVVYHEPCTMNQACSCVPTGQMYIVCVCMCVCGARCYAIRPCKARTQPWASPAVDGPAVPPAARLPSFTPAVLEVRFVRLPDGPAAAPSSTRAAPSSLGTRWEAGWLARRSMLTGL